MNTPACGRLAVAAAFAVALLPASASLLEVGFDDLPAPPGGANDGASAGGSFLTAEGFRVHNTFTDFGGGFTAWSGFAVSEVNDPSTPGFGNSFAVTTPGTGLGGGGRYLVGFDFGDEDRITFPFAAQPTGVFVNNTAYAALSLRDGDAFAKKFGGASGTDPDFFLLVVEGRDALGLSTGSAPIYLADYRSSGPADDFIRQAWTWLDLSALQASTVSLHFTLSSSDNGAFGMNTPAYFALDGLQVVVPEPHSAALLACGGLLLARARRRRP
jgi:hypothetical protein